MPTLEERADTFAQKAIENLKNGNIKKDTLPNTGVPFSVERDVNFAQAHKNLLESDTWGEFLEEVQ